MIFKQQKKIFELLKKLNKSHPYFVIIILHEYFRNLFPYDPHIKYTEKNPIKRILNLQKILLITIVNLKKFGFYKINFKDLKYQLQLKAKPKKFYDQFWKQFSKKELLNAKKFITERFSGFNSYNKNFFKGKDIIDVGCGSGRYANALRLLGGKKVIGIDYSNDGIKHAKKNYKYKNLIFKKQNVLNLKFPNNSFDIVFCNGVLHHTTNLKKGIDELVRICKPNGYIYLYLYGKGGIFWAARREMNKLIKKIPLNYSQKILDLIGMPTNRFIFMDNWYVLYERHCSHQEVYKILKFHKVKSIEKMKIGRKTDLESGIKNFRNSEIIWGEGEIRLLIKK